MDLGNESRPATPKVPKGQPDFEVVARRILDLNATIINCHIANDPDGAVLADIVREQYRGSVAGYSHAGSGMGPIWGISMINTLRRLDGERSKLTYVIVGREKFKAIFFPTQSTTRNLIVGLLLSNDSDPIATLLAVSKLIQAEMGRHQ